MSPKGSYKKKIAPHKVHCQEEPYEVRYNLLFKQIRSKQIMKFNEIIKDLREDRDLTQETAEEAFQGYPLLNKI